MLPEFVNDSHLQEKVQRISVLIIPVLKVLELSVENKTPIQGLSREEIRIRTCSLELLIFHNMIILLFS